MQQLRIHNGLHRGAVIPITEGCLSLGAADTCDVVLGDPGLLMHEADLLCRDGIVLLVAAGDGLRRTDGRRIKRHLRLRVGDFFELRGVLFSIDEEGAPWPDVATLRDDALRRRRAARDSDTTEAVSESASTQPRQKGWSLLQRTATALFVLLVAVALAGWISENVSRRVFADAARPKALDAPKTATAVKTPQTRATRPDAAHDSGGAHVSVPQPLQQLQNATTTAATTNAPVGRSKFLPDSEALAGKIRAGLARLDLNELVEVSIERDGIEVRGPFEPDDRLAIDRLVQKLRGTEGYETPVAVFSVAVADLLPFQVVSVTFGDDPSVTLDGNRRLRVGDRFKGYRLVSVDSSKVVFDGLRRLEIPW